MKKIITLVFTFLSFSLTGQQNNNPLSPNSVNDDFDNIQARMAGNETNDEINVWNEEGELKIVLYPNPAGDFIMYRTDISDNEDAVLIIYNMLGEAMHTEKINAHNQEGRIDLSTYVSGMYLYKVYINNAPVRAGPFVISK